MKKTKAFKRTLFTAVLSIILCVYMLIGATFAWFTDSSPQFTKIQSSRIDVALLMWNGENNAYEDISTNPKPIFGAGSIAQNNNAETVWEPGKTQVAYLAVVNRGNLSLKYQLGLNVSNPTDGNDLFESIQYALTFGVRATAETPNPVTEWNSANGNNVVLGRQIVSESGLILQVGEVRYFALSLHMSENSGNVYQKSKVDFDLTVYAAQMNYEF